MTESVESTTDDLDSIGPESLRDRESELEELTVFFDSLVDPRQSDDRANGEVIS